MRRPLEDHDEPAPVVMIIPPSRGLAVFWWGFVVVLSLVIQHQHSTMQQTTKQTDNSLNLQDLWTSCGHAHTGEHCRPSLVAAGSVRGAVCGPQVSVCGAASWLLLSVAIGGDLSSHRSLFLSCWLASIAKTMRGLVMCFPFSLSHWAPSGETKSAGGNKKERHFSMR